MSEDAATASPKRQIHVVYDEDVYDIPSLPDENKLFPITDDTFMYDVITTEQYPTSRSRLTAANVATASRREYRVRKNFKNFTTVLPNAESIRLKKNYATKKHKNSESVVTNYKAGDIKDFVDPKTERVSSQDVRTNAYSGLQTATDKHSSNGRGYKQKRKSGLVTRRNFNPYTVTTQVSSETIPEENTIVVVEVNRSANVSARTSVDVSDLSTSITTMTPRTIYDNTTTDRSKTVPNNVSESDGVPVTAKLQKGIHVHSAPENISTPDALFADVLPPTTTDRCSYFNNCEDLHIASTPKLADTESSSDGYHPDNASDAEFYVDASPTLSSVRNPTTLINSDMENIIINTSLGEKVIDDDSINSTVLEVTPVNEEVIHDYTTDINDTSPSKPASPFTHSLQNITANTTESNRNNYSQDNDTNSDNLTITNSKYLNEFTTDNSSRLSDNASRADTSTLLTYYIENVIKNFGRMDKNNSVRDCADSYFNQTTVRNTERKIMVATSGYHTQYSDTFSTRVPWTTRYKTAGENKKSKRGVWKRVKQGMGKVFHRKSGKRAEEAATEDYSKDEKPLKINIFTPNKTTTRKKSKTKKLWKGFKKLFRGKHNKTETTNAPESRSRESENSSEDKSQPNFITREKKYNDRDLENRYKDSFVLPLNRTKHPNFISKMKGWIRSEHTKRKENIPPTPKTSSERPINFIHRVRRKFNNVLSKRGGAKRDSEARMGRESHNRAVTLPSISKLDEVSTRSGETQNNGRKLRFWSKFKRLFVRQNGSDAEISSGDKSSIDPPIINDFSIRSGHKIANDSTKESKI